jgi:hypothetical protein
VTEQGKRTGIKYRDIYPRLGRRAKTFVAFEGRNAQIVAKSEEGHGGLCLDLDTHEGPCPRITICGEWIDYEDGEGFEFVETKPRSYW